MRPVPIASVGALAPHETTALAGILDGLTRSKESIKAAKDWILSHAHAADAITAELRVRTGHPMASFDSRLNIVYVVSDGCPLP